MKHFLEISQLSRSEIDALIKRAMHFKYHQEWPHYPEYTIANLFYEHSTRTRVSFECAANNLSLPVINLDQNLSSEMKGETLGDTVRNLTAMGISLFVIRHSQDGLPQQLVDSIGVGIHIINAGDGTHAHPSQAMLDMMTILEHKPNLSKLKIAIVGNLRHSRVANSLQCLFAQLGVGELVLVAPKIWQPSSEWYGRQTSDLAEGIAGADVIYTLRVQKERLEADAQIDLTKYRDEYCLTLERLILAKKDVMVLHPGPVNRGVEIDSAVVDGPHSYILRQVTNGVFMRMAILEALIL